MRTSTVTAAAFAGVVAAQGAPSNTTICDYYTTALLKNVTAENQATLLTLLVNTVVIGNYTKLVIEGVTWPDVAVPGILANGTVDGEDVNLLPYFNGGLASSNRGGSSGVAINFLDDGGAAPLMMNKPANGTSSNQYKLLTHLYQFFGTLLGCSAQGSGDAFPAYGGQASMYKVHKFMGLNTAEVTYFIQQVGAAAASFGVAESDITKVADALNGLFNVRCAAPAVAIPAQGAQLQSMCIAEDCKLAPNATCSSYEPVVEPGVANATLAMGEGNSSSTATAAAPSDTSATETSSSSDSPSGTGSESAPSSSISAGAAVAHGASLVAGGLGLIAFFL